MFASRSPLVNSLLRRTKNNDLFLNIPKRPLSSTGSLDLEHAVDMVQTHDPVGYLPGRLLPTKDMQETYYGVRSFWVETGLRFGTTANVPPNSSPAEHLEWWKQGLVRVYDTTQQEFDHPTMRLLRVLVQKHALSKRHFDNVLLGREKDLELKQYPTLSSLVEHAEMSCGSLLELVLEGGGVRCQKAYEAAHAVGICHGLTNALRLSIPIVSTTGKLVLPQDLCAKHGIRNPRYLLSALSMGDQKGQEALQYAVQDIAHEARSHLQRARDLRPRIVHDNKAVAAMIPGVASQVFLDRLESKQYNLTDRNLRNVGFLEHAMCQLRMILSYYQKTY